MANEQKFTAMASECAPFINFPEPYLKFISELRPRLSATAILVYVNYWRHWRYGDYKLVISNHDIAIQVAMDVSSVKRANSQLVNAGLITRDEQTKKSSRGTTENTPSITLPRTPEGLKKILCNTTMRKPFKDKQHGEIASFAEALTLIESDEDFENNQGKLEFSDVQKAIGDLFSNGLVDRLTYSENALARQVAWSIREGQLSRDDYETDGKRLNAAIKLVKNGVWKKPRRFPRRWGLNLENND